MIAVVIAIMTSNPADAPDLNPLGRLASDCQREQTERDRKGNDRQKIGCDQSGQRIGGNGRFQLIEQDIHKRRGFGGLSHGRGDRRVSTVRGE